MCLVATTMREHAPAAAKSDFEREINDYDYSTVVLSTPESVKSRPATLLPKKVKSDVWMECRK